jgi:nitroreductase
MTDTDHNAAGEMGLFDAIYNCRAMRKLDTKAVPEEDLIKLVDAANQAPSGSNMQAGRWLIVRDPEVKRGLAALNRAGVEAYIGPMVDNPGLLTSSGSGQTFENDEQCALADGKYAYAAGFNYCLHGFWREG